MRGEEWEGSEGERRTWRRAAAGERWCNDGSFFRD